MADTAMATQPTVEGTAEATQPTVEGTAEAQPEQKKRGKPKDPNAPPKPKAPFQQFGGPARERLKAERPELLVDLSAMGKALAEEWAKVSDDEKAKMQAVYEKEMEIWRPKWAAYKETDGYKKFFEIKQDWIDARALKKLQKKMTTDAPKRPKSSYMLFAAEVRDECNEEAKAKGLGMGDAARMIAERWQALSEDKKAAFEETSRRQKAVFEVEFGKYRKGESFRDYMDAKSKMEAKQKLKKNLRTSHDSAPKKPPSGYSLFKAEVMPSIVAENEERSKNGEVKWGLKEIAGELKKKWEACPADKKEALAKEAEKHKSDYMAKVKEFKGSDKYLKFVEQRNLIKSRENRMLNLRDMPKRPKSVFALFAADHKDEVPPGKGEGKGMSALKVKFSEASTEEKAKYTKIEQELKEQWMKEVEEFKASDRFKNFHEVKKKVLKEFLTDAEKVTTVRFLDEAPPAPPKSAFALFLNEKRKRENGDADLRDAKAKKEEVQAARKEWLKMDRVAQKEYDVQKGELFKKFEEDCKAYMQTEKWQAYVKEARRLKVPVKSLLFHKKKVKKLLKGEKMKPSMIALPEKPATFPSKARSANRLFMAEKRAEKVPIDELPKMWAEMSAEDRAPYNEAALEESKREEEETRAFRTSEEGMKYLRLKKSVLRRRKILAAKNKYLDDMPQKPKSAVIMWMQKQLPIVKKESPGLKGFEIKAKLTAMWAALEGDEKKEAMEEGNEAMKAYQTKLNEFKAGDNWKSFVLATRIKKKMIKKIKKGAIPAGPKKPESFPKKPLGAYQMYCKEQAGSGKNIKELYEMFGKLEADEKRRLMEDEKERTAKYQEEMKAFMTSEAGRKYNKAVESFKKKQRLAIAKKKFMKDEPKRPLGAYMMWSSHRRATLSQDFPDCKGLPAQQKKLTELWRTMEEDEKSEWHAKETAARKEYDEAMQQFQNSDNYKKFKATERKILGVPKAKGAGKGAKKAPSFAPKAPENMPKKPPSGFFIFLSEQRKEGKSASPKESTQAWTNLGADGQKVWQDKARELDAQYQKELAAFNASADGKKYNREKIAADKKKRIAMIKQKYEAKLPKEPKRPPSAYFIFTGEKNSEVQGDMREKAQKVSEMWKNLGEEERAVYEKRAGELKAKYEEEMTAYKKNKDVKAMTDALDRISGKKARLIAQKKRQMQVKKQQAEKAKAAKVAKPAKGKGRGAAKAAAKAAAAPDSDSDSDVMGSDSGNSSSDDSDSD